ncbi:hypothetical protein [Massilia sp. BSC265]|uniref:hypothetical protein n=1 Tax=Massilia sp. BSC265 TaxID=1549812 RepID=UPI001269F0D7|nr:hypothetical protein [Massilia sp. BSC265]
MSAFGNPKDEAVRGCISGKAAMAKADAYALAMKPLLEVLENEGITSRSAVARALRELGVPTPRGGAWDARKVTNLIGRIAVIKVST